MWFNWNPSWSTTLSAWCLHTNKTLWKGCLTTNSNRHLTHQTARTRLRRAGESYIKWFGLVLPWTSETVWRCVPWKNLNLKWPRHKTSEGGWSAAVKKNYFSQWLYFINALSYKLINAYNKTSSDIGATKRSRATVQNCLEVRTKLLLYLHLGRNENSKHGYPLFVYFFALERGPILI